MSELEYLPEDECAPYEGGHSATTALGFLPDGRLIVGKADGSVGTWTVARKPGASWNSSVPGSVVGLCLVHRGEVVAAGGGGHIRFLDSGSGRELGRVRAEFETLAVAEAGESVALGYLGGGVNLRSRAGGEWVALRVPGVLDRMATFVGFSPDGSCLVAGGMRSLSVFRSKDGESLAEIEGGLGGPSSFSADGTQVLVGDGVVDLQILELPGGRRLQWTGPPPDGACGASLSPDGSRWACGTHYAAPVWSGPSNSEHADRKLVGHEYRVQVTCFSRDGSTLASGDDGGEVRIWRIEDGELLAAWHP